MAWSVRGNTNGAGWLVAQSRQRGQFGVNFLQTRASSAEQTVPCLGRRDTAGGAGQQSQAKPGFEPADGLAQRRL